MPTPRRGGKKSPSSLLPCFALWILSLLAVAAMAGDPYSAWKYRRDLTFDTSPAGAAVAGDLENFPVLVRLHAGNFDFARAKADGSDLRFSDADGAALAYEVERWDKAKSAAEIWVKVPKVDGNSKADGMAMHWGNAGASSESDGAKVFAASSGFHAVWHLSEGGTGARRNSVSAGNSATPKNYDGDESRPGLIGFADSLAAATGIPTAAEGDYLDLGPGFTDFSGGFTYSVWAYLPGNAHHERLLELGNGSKTNNIILGRLGETDSMYFESITNPDFLDRVHAGDRIVRSTWQHWAATMQGKTARIYVNGVQVGVGDLMGPMVIGARAFNYIGKSTWDSDRYLTGKVDQPEISNVQRGPDWIKLAYESQRPDGNFLAFGPVTEAKLTIVMQPAASLSLKEGATLTLRASAVSALPLTYAWYQDGRLRASGNSETLNIPSVRASDAGTWHCQVSDGQEQATTTHSLVAVAENPALWSRSMAITVNTTALGADVPGKVTDFPILVRLKATHFDFSQAQAGGADLRFTDAAGNFLAYYVASWRPTFKEALVWVLLPEVAGNSAAASNSFTMLWGRADAVPLSSGARVFAPSKGWRGMYNLGETSGSTAHDATGNGFAGTITGAAGDVPGVAGKGFRFAGSGDRVALPQGATDSLRAFTVAFWVKETTPMGCNVDWQCPTLFGADAQLLASGDFWIYSKLGKLSMGHGVLAEEDPITGDAIVNTPIALDDGKWHHVAVTWTGTEMKLHEGGKPVATSPTEEIPLTQIPYDIGNLRHYTGNRINGLKGDMDEVMLLSRAQGQDWVKLAYETQRPDAFAISYGIAAALPLAPPTASPPPGTYAAPLKVTLTAESGATIHYTLGGDAPTVSSLQYLDTLTLYRDAALRAIAVKDGKISGELSVAYSLKRTLSPGARDTVRAGDTVALGDGAFVRLAPGANSIGVILESLELPASVRGFDRIGPLLRAAPYPTSPTSGPFPGVVITGAPAGVSMFGLEDGAAVPSASPDGNLRIPSPGDWFWARDTTAPRIAWLGSVAVGADSVRAAFRVVDNVRDLKARLRFVSGRADSTAWADARSGDSLAYAIALSASEPVEVAFAVTDRAFTVRYPASEGAAFSLGRPLPSASPITLGDGGLWTLAGLPILSEGLTMEAFAKANGGGLHAAVWMDDPEHPGTGEYRMLKADEALPSGKALWLASEAARKGLVFPSPRSLPSDSDGGFSVELGPGWNLVANPSLRPLRWIVHSGDREAHTKSPVKGLHGHDGVGYEHSDSLAPWKGYYVFNHGEKTVVRLGGASPLAKPAAPGLVKTAAPGILDLSLLGPGGEARLAARAWASDAVGREDDYSPPPAGGRRQGIWLLRGGRALSADVVRLAEGSAARWTAAIRNAQGTPTSLALRADALPAGTQVWAAFPSRGVRLRVDGGEPIPAAAEDTVLLFAGTAASLAGLAELRDLAAAPGTFHHGYRRGARGWELRLALPAAAEVRLRLHRLDGSWLGGFTRRAVAGWHAWALPMGAGVSQGVCFAILEATWPGASLRKTEKITGFGAPPGN